MKITERQLRRIIREMADVSIKQAPAGSFAQTRSAIGYGSTNAYQNITGQGFDDASAIADLEKQLPRKIKQINNRIAALEQELSDIKAVRAELMSPTNLVQHDR